MRIVSGSRERTMKVWDGGTGQLARRLKGHTDAVDCVAFATGQRIVSGSDDSLRGWDAETGGESLALPNDESISSLRFSPDGKQIVSGGFFGTVKVWLQLRDLPPVAARHEEPSDTHTTGQPGKKPSLKTSTPKTNAKAMAINVPGMTAWLQAVSVLVASVILILLTCRRAV